MREHWFKQAVFYGVDVEFYCDADGDGCGDFRGLTGKLDYLADLGVDCLWLLPFYHGPHRDNGYDVSDHCAIDPRFGTPADFRAFVSAARECGLRVLIDLIANHTSDQHPWFQQARRDPASPYRDYYVWRKQPPQDDDPDLKPIFPGVEDGVWSYDNLAGQYYRHRFYHHQPDLNWGNPAVRDEIFSIMRFWLQQGIAGFRVDAVPYLYPPGRRGEAKAQALQDLLDQMRRLVDEFGDDIILIGEADVEPGQVAAFTGDGNRLHMLFNFLLDNYLFLAFARESADPLRHVLRELAVMPSPCAWANFARNLDELDLERLSDADREEVYARFAPDESMRIYGRGIRRRLAPMLDGDPRRIELVFSLLCSVPGAPLIVYGDEIGMGDDLSLPERDSVRMPMQWSSAPNGGFSTAPPEQLSRPSISGGPFGFQRVNVADQHAQPGAVLNRVRRLFHARGKHPALAHGDWQLLDAGDPVILAQRTDHAGRTLITLHNLAATPRNARLNLSVPLHDVLADQEYPRPSAEIPLAGFGYRWVELNAW